MIKMTIYACIYIAVMVAAMFVAIHTIEFLKNIIWRKPKPTNRFDSLYDWLEKERRRDDGCNEDS